jgi:hypothetical protein
LNGKTYQNKIKKEQAITQIIFIKKTSIQIETESKRPVSKSETESKIDEDDDMFNGLDELKN